MKAQLLACALALVACASGPTYSEALKADESIVLIGEQRLRPTPLHFAVVHMVSGCVGRPIDPRSIRWIAADTIVSAPSGILLYGVAARGPTVVIERTYWLNPTVISHELCHILGLLEGDELLSRCTVYAGVTLPARYVSDEQLGDMKDRGRVVRFASRREGGTP